MSMSSLKMVEDRLPPGFRFHPKDEELVCDYLMKKVTRSEHPPFLMEIDLNKSEPWDIPDSASVGGKEWYFYSQRDRKYAIGLRTNRATISGYWKATGKDRSVSRKGSLVGMRKTLVFYQGRAPRGKKSDWVMHEFRLEGPLGAAKLSSSKEDWVLCRVFCKGKEVMLAKQGIGNSCCSYEDTTTSSTNYDDLPPLMDIAPPPPPPYITSGQTHNEQVHCFSNIFTQNQTNCPNLFSNFNSNSNSHHIMMRTTKNTEQQPNIYSKLTTLLPTIYLNNFNNNTNNYNNTNTNNNYYYNYNYNNSPPPLNMMMIEDSPTSFGEGSNSEISFLSEVGDFPTIWQNHY